MGEASGLSWLGGKTWAQVTREERFFCAELFFVIRKDVCRFVRFLNQGCHWVEGKRTDERANLIANNNDWDAAYEACFYRDIEHHRRTDGRTTRKLGRDYQKRTFDLALFSNDVVILIEAKAQQGFKNKQLKSMCSDRRKVGEWTGNAGVFLVGLISSEYSPFPETQGKFDLMITWNSLSRLYGDDEGARRIFDRANEIYRDTASRKRK